MRNPNEFSSFKGPCCKASKSVWALRQRSCMRSEPKPTIAASNTGTNSATQRWRRGKLVIKIINHANSKAICPVRPVTTSSTLALVRAMTAQTAKRRCGTGH